MDHIIQVAEIFATNSPEYGEFRSAPKLNEDLYLNVYPNPVSGMLNVESNEPIKSIQCYNETGRIVQTIDTKDDHLHYAIPTTSWKEGLYIIEITFTHENRVYRKIIKTGQ